MEMSIEKEKFFAGGADSRLFPLFVCYTLPTTPLARSIHCIYNKRQPIKISAAEGKA